MFLLNKTAISWYSATIICTLGTSLQKYSPALSQAGKVWWTLV